MLTFSSLLNTLTFQAIKSVIYAPEKEFGKKSFVVLKEVSF
jgi:hypothetical protein